MTASVSSVYRCHRCGTEAPGRGPELIDHRSGRWRGPFKPDRWMEAAYPASTIGESRVDLCAACARIVSDALRPLDPRADMDGES